MTPVAMHAAFERLLDSLTKESGVSRSGLASVLVRAMVVAPEDVVRADIARGTMLGRPRPLNPAAVSKAVTELVAAGLLSEEPLQSDNKRAGRPVKPVRMGSDRWGLMGFKIIHADSKPTALTGVLMTLRADILAELHVDLSEDVTFETVADHIEKLASELKVELARTQGKAKSEDREILAVGVEVASHVHNGRLIGATHMGLPVDEDYDLMTPLQERLKLPVVIDNDVNVLAVRELYRSVYKERDIALVAVFQDGVGGSLILDGHVYRGGGGLAAEPGHQRVAVSLDAAPIVSPSGGVAKLSTGFSAPCHCERSEHVDCYAVPARLLAEIPEASSLAEAAGLAARNMSGELTRAGWAFRIGGSALGQGIAAVINVVNPSRVVLVLPSDLCKGNNSEGTAGAEYLRAVEESVDEYSFSSGPVDARAGADRLTVEVLKEDQVRLVGATSAAIRAFDTFISHARGRDECQEQLPLGEVKNIA